MQASLESVWQTIVDAVANFNATEIFAAFKEDPDARASLGVSVLVGVLTVLVFVLLTWRLSVRRPKCVVILGPSNSGKTTLFSKLSGSDWIGTVPSMAPNYAPLKKIGDADASHVQLVDIPGSPGLAHHIPKHLKQATVVIFMLDSADFLQTAHDIAEKLYQVLDDPFFKKRALPLLIALNKSDLGARCNTEKFVCSRLQKEIAQIRSQRTGKPDSEQPFEFDSLKSEVSISKISVILDDGLGPVYELLKKHVK